MIKNIKAKIHWYDNKSNEGMAIDSQGNLLWVNNQVMKFKPELNQGDIVRIRGMYDGYCWNIAKVVQS